MSSVGADNAPLQSLQADVKNQKIAELRSHKTSLGQCYSKRNGELLMHRDVINQGCSKYAVLRSQDMFTGGVYEQMSVDKMSVDKKLGHEVFSWATEHSDLTYLNGFGLAF